MNKPYAGLALLTDLDGTLLMPDKTVSAEDAAAIADFVKKAAASRSQPAEACRQRGNFSRC
jgi:hypothetical protein